MRSEDYYQRNTDPKEVGIKKSQEHELKGVILIRESGVLFFQQNHTANIDKEATSSNIVQAHDVQLV
jgi:hypothetical protein